MHNLIDGLAIGVFTNPEDLIVLAISIVIEEIPQACTVGSTFLAKGYKLNEWSTRILFGLYVIASPVGMIIGMNINSEPNIALVIV